MKVLLLAVVIAVAYAVPAKKLASGADQCGAADITKSSKRYIPTQNSDASCEICLDLVLIGETYAECEEAVVEHHMEAYCKEHVKNKASQAACILMIDDIAHAVIEDTDENPTAVCKRVIHKDCPYN